MDINDLTLSVASHLSKREVVLRWENPPSESAVGQVIKTASGQVVIYIGNLEGVDTRFRVLLHECAHVALDYSWLPVSADHKLPSGSIKRTQSQRDAWCKNEHEAAAQKLADEWLEHANKNAYKYWRVGRSEMARKLLSLLDWRG